jgi:O-antigen/teichoic acid export membrane protein
MIRVLLVIIGIVGLVVGIRRATGTQPLVRVGNYKAAGAALASGLLIALGGFVVTVLGLSWSIWAALGGLVIGGVVAGAGGRMVFRDIQKQVSGG